MSSPIIVPADLGTYLNDPGIDVPRAAGLIGDAQTLCESIVFPLPATATVVVKRMAGRAYTSILSPRQASAAAAGGQFLGQTGGGVYLTDEDIADLRRSAGGGGAFSIDTLPAGYTVSVPWWDTDSGWYGPGDWDQIP